MVSMTSIVLSFSGTFVPAARGSSGDLGTAKTKKSISPANHVLIIAG